MMEPPRPPASIIEEDAHRCRVPHASQVAVARTSAHCCAEMFQLFLGSEGADAGIGADDVDVAELLEVGIDGSPEALSRRVPDVTAAGVRTIRRSIFSTIAHGLVELVLTGLAGYAIQGYASGVTRSTAMMSAPSAASRTACDRPWPRAAPVIKATLPLTRPISTWSSLRTALVYPALLLALRLRAYAW